MLRVPSETFLTPLPEFDEMFFSFINTNNVTIHSFTQDFGLNGYDFNKTNFPSYEVNGFFLINSGSK